MVNDQLKNFVKQSLEQGASREKISQDLLTGGWNQSDINEAFSLLDPSTIKQALPTIPHKKSHKLPILFIILFLLLSGAFVSYKFGYLNKFLSKNDLKNVDAMDQVSGENFKGTDFVSFLANGGSYECQISRYIDPAFMPGVKMSGTAFVDGKNIRVDYEPRMFSLIYKDAKTYWWWGEANPNYKYHPNEGYVEELPSSTYSWKPGDITDYDCKAWTTDISKFEVPNNLHLPQQIPALGEELGDPVPLMPQ